MAFARIRAQFHITVFICRVTNSPVLSMASGANGVRLLKHEGVVKSPIKAFQVCLK